MTTVEVEVTSRDIALGIKEDCNSCPVARALMRTLKRHIDVYGHSAVVYQCAPIEDNRMPAQATAYADICLPEEATDFVLTFDEGEYVEPFKFSLIVPDEFTEVLPA